MTDEKIKVSLVGCGHRGKEMLKLLLDTGDFVVHALVDDVFDATTIEGVDSPYRITYNLFWDSRALLETDLVMIASVNNLHAEHIYRSLSAGKYVFCEKPLYTPKPHSLEWCDFKDSSDWEKELKNLILKNSDRFCTGFVLRHAPLYLKIKEEIEKIGKITSGTATDLLHYGHGALIFGSSWRHDPDKSGGHVVEKLVHVIDLLCWYLNSDLTHSCGSTGPDIWIKENKEISKDWIMSSENPSILKAYKFYGSNDEGPFAHEKGEIVESSGNSVLGFHSGASINIHFNTACPESRREFFFVGEKGTLQALWSPTESFVKVTTRGVGTKDFNGAPNHVDLFQFPPAGCHGGGDKYIIESLRNTVLKGETPNPSVSEALRTMDATLVVQDSL